ncbi:MAG TPA: IS1182 family transposase [Aestuariivirgaceae bacterium]|nr:IS1182 family transposase [Aestuariivirgaceae bacterium]
MMGRRDRDQASLFYDFNLDDVIPESHLLRRLNVFVTMVLADLRAQLQPFYSDIGRPSVDPELMLRMLIVGYCYGIRHERKLCEEVKLHLAYRWFCKLDLDDKVPHHSTFSENRLNRFRKSDILRHVFERVVAACMAQGLVKGEGFAVDASVMEADASRYRGKAPDEIDWSQTGRQSRAVAEYLAALEHEEPNPDRKPPKVISLSDPSSAWTAKANKRVQFGYGLNYLIDIENAVIVDVEATPARTYDEVAATRTMIERTEERLDLKPDRLAADTAYGTGKFLGWLVTAGITPHIPVWDKGNRDDGTFSRRDFTFDKQKNEYRCPTGKVLRTTGRVHDGGSIRYRASKLDCDACPLKPKCCPNMPARQVPRDVNEDARDHARALMGTPEFEKSRNERKRVEMRFAHLKTHHRFERLRLRGLTGARDEFHLAAIVQNLKTMALRLLRPSPESTARCVA